MNTHDSTATPPSSRPLGAVQQLLETLDDMRAEGLGAKERLEFLTSHGPAHVRDFDLEDAFDLEMRARNSRLGRLEDLDRDLRQLTASWRGAPLPEDVRQAGTSLLEHAGALAGDALRDERRSEIHLLEQVWQSAPDVRHAWPWLTAWGDTLVAHPTKEEEPPDAEIQAESAHSDPDEDVRQPDEGDEPELEAGRELEAPGVDGEDEGAEFRGLEPDDAGEELERRVRQLDSGEMRRDYEVRRADDEAGWVSRELGTSSSSEKARMRQRVWTEALREVSLEPWKFRFEAPGHLGEWGLGRAVVWKHGRESYSSARLEWAPSRPQHHNVRLRVSSDALGPRELARELSDVQLRRLNLDPVPFVRDALDPDAEQ